jgi:hypothetical protein
MRRRDFLHYLATAPFLSRFHALAAQEKKKTKIRDIQAMILQGPRTYTW